MPLQLPVDQWTEAACRVARDTLVQDKDFAYPHGSGGRSQHWKAQRFINTYCANCLILKLCEKMGEDEPFGIWGGRTEEQRKQAKAFLTMFT